MLLCEQELAPSTCSQALPGGARSGLCRCTRREGKLPCSATKIKVIGARTRSLMIKSHLLYQFSHYLYKAVLFEAERAYYIIYYLKRALSA